MITIFFRTIFLFIFVVIAIRIMGKAELSELQPFELVVIIMIAELASIPMEDVNIPFINGIVSIFTLVFIQIIISIINLKSEKARAIICGKPSVLIEKGKIVEKELRNLRINMNDLIEQLRLKNFHNINDVEFAILETNGDLSVIPKSDKKPLTASDIGLSLENENLPMSIIIDGKINYNNLKKISLDFNWLYKELKKQNINDVTDILYASIDKNMNLNIHKKNENET
ncbi:Uncharacterized membrane protein YcaP, DUF421 family [Caminicella sporogenes DSM 14501]|uniref:Uncharacterized membrane protein YcaP, DUF421 family n=1 Tax=Caminicella sporogenes DSM 14501 TaxID=1121266 RepID=A0A1M6S5W3_9FIRM|nr:DUF421 domain-containing protein [Caminicella sporogenes]RKD27206.1 hypothetical protein BET04_09840 [Caminicella sporogenes]SHK40076.1 Uncharacterized membrane protein YcaP, DUF421 family [Caminicella sporogenes DSM 14501]